MLSRLGAFAVGNVAANTLLDINGFFADPNLISVNNGGMTSLYSNTFSDGSDYLTNNASALPVAIDIMEIVLVCSIVKYVSGVIGKAYSSIRNAVFGDPLEQWNTLEKNIETAVCDFGNLAVMKQDDYYWQLGGDVIASNHKQFLRVKSQLERSVATRKEGELPSLLHYFLVHAYNRQREIWININDKAKFAPCELARSATERIIGLNNFDLAHSQDEALDSLVEIYKGAPGELLSLIHPLIEALICQRDGDNLKERVNALIRVEVSYIINILSRHGDSLTDELREITNKKAERLEWLIREYKNETEKLQIEGHLPKPREEEVRQCSEMGKWSKKWIVQCRCEREAEHVDIPQYEVDAPRSICSGKYIRKMALGLSCIFFLIILGVNLGLGSTSVVLSPKDSTNNIQVQEKPMSEARPNVEEKKVAENNLSHAAGYSIYANKKYGYSIAYPDSFILDPNRSPNEDGVRLVSKDKQAALSVDGTSVGDSNIRELYEFTKTAVKGTPGYKGTGQVGYNVLGETWYVVTWSANGKLYYKKEFVGSQSRNRFTFSFPEKMREQYEPIVIEMEKTFKAGDLERRY